MNAPPEYKTAGTLMLISGVLNILASAAWILFLIWFCVGAFWFIPLGVAIAELVVGIGVASGNPNRGAKVTSIIGIVNSLLCMNIVSLVLQIIAFTKLSTFEVQDWHDTALLGKYGR